ncbi:MAG: fructosamine kinase family protein [Bacteroidota bacterium]
MENIISSICKHAGVNYQHHKAVQGGDISKSFKIETGEGLFFLKINDASAFRGMFQKEADGLKAISETGAITTPLVKGTGEFNGYQWLMLEWLEEGDSKPALWEVFANNLAALHANTHKHYGWHYDNYIGLLIQQNPWYENWDEFYMNNRVMPLVKKLFNASAFSVKELEATESLFKRIANVYPHESPALLHGDLWCGNFMITKNEKPVLYDPAVYYGHREMDIAMTKLFGGFDNLFYNHYNHKFPLEKDWEKRLSLSQLYPLLVHAVLFGGNYISQCSRIIKSWQ